MKTILTVLLFFIGIFRIHAQIDSVKVLHKISITGYKTVNGVGHMPPLKDGIIYTGKKNEVIMVDSLDANKAINNTRQILGRIPGLNIVETESGGFTANGIGTRGLNPTQSIEMNTRQNGYNISADVYGYNESYYVPPMEAVQRIEMLRGAASLQFGAHFGGLVNYITDNPMLFKKFQFVSASTAGSFGLVNLFNSIALKHNKLSFYTYLQIRHVTGDRPNSVQNQVSAFASLKYKYSDKIIVGVEYSLLRNLIQMPGGLSDSMFHQDAHQSIRKRNWLKSPWNIINVNTAWNISPKTSLSIKNTLIFSSRSLVWKNEDGGPESLDSINSITGQFLPREVGTENMKSNALEMRLSAKYKLGNQESFLAAGYRLSYGSFNRKGGGEGTTAANYDLTINGDWGYNLNFTTLNAAAFLENVFTLDPTLTITPGLRIEYLNSTVGGYKIIENNKTYSNEKRIRKFPLFGIGVEFKNTPQTNLYANISQAFRPIDYSQLEPFGVVAKIDPELKDAYGFNSDLGYRGTIKNYLNFDVGLFYLSYRNRIGEILKIDPVTGNQYGYRTNVANSVHKGIETYIEFNLLKYLDQNAKSGLSIFNSAAFINAQYTSGNFKDKRVEAAPRIIERAGLIYAQKNFTATFQLNYVSDSYGDASNAKITQNPIGGYIPSYSVLDYAITWKIKNNSIKAGINNVLNKIYFTRRTDEYPGPGIIPSVGRSFYIGFSKKIG